VTDRDHFGDGDQKGNTICLADNPVNIPSPMSSVGKKASASDTNASFDQGIDFIPLACDPSSEAEWATRRRNVEYNERRNGRERTPPAREWDKGKASGSDTRVSRDRRGDYWDRDADHRKGKVRERSWERGSERNRSKRKLEIDADDFGENKRQRTAPSSRKAPWVKDVDWKRYNNVAELYVSPFEV